MAGLSQLGRRKEQSDDVVIPSVAQRKTGQH